MPQIDTTKDDLLRSLATERDWWRAVLDLASKDVDVTGDEEIDGSWTLKTLLGHITAWRDLTISRLETAERGSGTPTPPWPSRMPDETEEDVDAINAWFVEQSQAASFEPAVERLFGQIDTLEALVRRMPDEDLFTKGNFSRFGEGFDAIPIGPALIGYSITHVHQDHAPALAAWLTVRRGQHAELPPTPSNFGYDE
jgi:hypothetical protein